MTNKTKKLLICITLIIVSVIVISLIVIFSFSDDSQSNREDVISDSFSTSTMPVTQSQTTPSGVISAPTNNVESLPTDKVTATDESFLHSSEPDVITTVNPIVTDTVMITSEPTAMPTSATQTVKPTVSPTSATQTVKPTVRPTTATQTVKPTVRPTSATQTVNPTVKPTSAPTVQPTPNVGYDSSSNVQILLQDTNTKIINNNGGVIVMNNGNVYITKAGEYDVSGTLTDKSLVVEMPDTDKATINFKGVNISSSVSAPISILTGDKVEISAANGTINSIVDNGTESTDATGGAIDASVDLEIKGKGTLNVTSKYNNGIDTNDDLEIKNLTLKVTSPNNSIKGNDSVTVESGNITVISTKGDGIKTTNTEISAAGNQRGIITVLGGTLNIFAACDGIDASYDAVLSGGTVNIYTASFSDYSESLPATATVVASSSRARPQRPGTMPGGPGGGGMNEGNPDSTEYSCKGIKAENSVKISGGTISVKSNDDAIHTNNEVDISGGTINLYTNDDGIHGNTSVTISAGKINIEKSYEGIEGTNININGGTINITSSDDALNANATSSYLNISGGVVYFNAGGDGIDSNSNVVMTGGAVLAQGPSNGGNGVIDYDRSFSFKGGLLLVVGANGMNQKPSTTSGNTVFTKNISTNTSSYVTLTVDGKVVAVIKITKNSQSYCVAAFNNAAYGNSGSVSVSTSTSVSLTDGLYYIK